jgi:hypothetical protein
MDQRPPPHQQNRRRLGLPVWLIVALGLLAAPRAVLHDLDVVSEGSPITVLLVFGPLVVWVVVAVRLAGSPFLALLAAGGIYGICLAAVHNIFWSRTWAGDPPRLGGNLEGRLSAPTEELLMRGATTLSSLFTGLAVGTVCGVAAWAITHLIHRRRSAGRTPDSWSGEDRFGR